MRTWRSSREWVGPPCGCAPGAIGKMPTGRGISSSTSTSICSTMSLRKPVSAAAALTGFRNDIVEQIDVLLDDEIPLPVGIFPIAPGAQPQGGPTHSRELRQVLIDHRLAIV